MKDLLVSLQLAAIATRRCASVVRLSKRMHEGCLGVKVMLELIDNVTM
jgi:hypothetical protein